MEGSFKVYALTALENSKETKKLTSGFFKLQHNSALLALLPYTVLKANFPF